jgi:hypothetical protein
MLTCEILILPDGRILAHQLSPAMAGVLRELNPADETMNRRARRGAARPPTSGAGAPSVTKFKFATAGEVAYPSGQHHEFSNRT